MKDTRPVGASHSVWSGFYLGGHLGGGWGEVKSDGDKFELEGFVGGGHIGYNFLTGGVVLGIEADISFADLEKKATEGGIEIRVGTDWLGSVRARVGLPIDRSALIYATGGIAFGNAEVSATAGGINISADTNMTGYVVGGGAELAFAPNMIGRIEALHYGFDDQDINVFGANTKFDSNVTVVRAGVSFKLN